MKKLQAGFTVVEVVLVLVVVLGLGALGYMVMKHTNKTDKPAVTNSQGSVPAATTTATAPDIQATSDLGAATQALDQTDIDGNTTDSHQLDSQLNAF